MQKENLLSLFKKGSQKHRIVQRILDCGYITTIQFLGMYILCHSARVTEIRAKLQDNDYDIIATRIKGSTTSRYKIIERGVK